MVHRPPAEPSSHERALRMRASTPRAVALRPLGVPCGLHRALGLRHVEGIKPPRLVEVAPCRVLGDAASCVAR